MSVFSITKQIKDFALNECGLDKVGIAPVSRFNQSPEGFHPTDFLPGCKYVIAFCIRLPDGAVEAAMRTSEDRKPHLRGIYGTYGYTIAPNWHLMYGSYRLSQYIEKLTGCITTPSSCGSTQGPEQLSVRHAAVAAGLGEFGWSSLVLTPEFGPRNRFGAIMTTAELVPDPMYNGPKLCDPSKCHVCEKLCPTQSIPPYNEGQTRCAIIGDKVQIYGQNNWSKCQLSCHGMRKNEIFDKDIAPTGLTNPLQAELIPYLKYFDEVPLIDSTQHVDSWNCGRCLQYCPVGNWKERFYDTGLSKIDIRHYMDDEEIERRYTDDRKL